MCEQLISEGFSKRQILGTTLTNYHFKAILMFLTLTGELKKKFPLEFAGISDESDDDDDEEVSASEEEVRSPSSSTTRPVLR